jgi:hypothetical protein
MDHLANYPLQIDETNDEEDNQGIEFQAMYHRKFAHGSHVTVRIDNTLFHATVIRSEPFAGCYLIILSVQESFLLRNVEQIIRIKDSHLSPEEWVSRYGSDFPKE